ILIVPIYNSFLITEQIGLSASYFHEFNHFKPWRVGIFVIGLTFVMMGISAITVGQEKQSLEHHEKDQKERVANAFNESKSHPQKPGHKAMQNLSFARLALSVLRQPYSKVFFLHCNILYILFLFFVFFLVVSFDSGLIYHFLFLILIVICVIYCFLLFLLILFKQTDNFKQLKKINIKSQKISNYPKNKSQSNFFFNLQQKRKS
ncbi:hypothetical protein RFI_00350, partial [Reticulomyxa filosa]